MDRLRSHFLEVWDYEFWANSLWLDYFTQVESQHHGAQFIADASKDLSHILSCYRGWLNSVLMEQTDAVDDLRMENQQQIRRLKAWTESVDFDGILEIKGSNGVRRFTYQTLIHHMQNHGTYHRGQMRQRAEQYGLSDWPETDRVKFSILEKPVNVHVD